MSQSLLSILLFLLVVLCCICGPAYAESTVEPESVELFVRGKTKVPFKETNGTVTEKDVKDFYSPFLVSADGVMVALAAADYIGYSEGNIDIVAKYIGTKAEDWAKKAMGNDVNNWETQLAIQNEVHESFLHAVGSPLAVGKDNKIYLLAVNYNVSKKGLRPQNDQDWGFVLTVGEVKITSDETNKTIEWRMLEPASSKLTKQFKDASLWMSPSGGYSFLTEDGQIVFVMKAEKKEEQDVFVVIYSNVTGDNKEVEFFYVEITDDCDSSYFFYWGEKLIMVPNCTGISHKLKESTDMGKTWRDAEGSISSLWPTLRDKRDFRTVTIDNKKVLLFVEAVSPRAHSVARNELYLWMSDGNRVYPVGPIVLHDNQVTVGGILHTNSELFFLHQQWNNNNKPLNIILTRLKDQLEKIKSVLKTWDEKDKYLSSPCNETTPQGTLCATPMPTDGLIGFLSNTTSGDDNNIWVNEYLYVNATVKGGTKVDNGFTFSGTNAGAQWSIGSQGQSLRYDFSRYGLTVVATVTIHNVPKSDSPLLTIGRVLEEKRPGLWYNKDKQWQLMRMEGNVSAKDWETNKSYRVALILQNNSVSAYIDGEPLGDPLRISANEAWLLFIEHIFIGGYKTEEGSQEIADRRGDFTFTNVLLYSRPFNVTELQAMGKNGAETIEPKGHTGETTGPKGHTGDTTESKGHTEDTIESKGHPGDITESKGHPGDITESKGQTGQSPEGGKGLQQSLSLTNSQDSCVYMPVVTSLSCLLGLWGLTVLC